MVKKLKIVIISLMILGFLLVQLLVSIRNIAAYERPEPYFKLELLAPTNNPQRVLHTQIIARELWKIGIDVELQLLGWDGYLRRLNRGEWEVFMGGWAGIPFTQYHSRRSNVVNSSALDHLLDHIATEPDFSKAHKSVIEALKIIVWEKHPGIGFYQTLETVARDAALQGWFGSGFDIPYPSLFFEDDKQSTLIRAIVAQFTNLNPAFDETMYDDAFRNPAFSHLYEEDADEILRPVLAAADPIALSSTESLSQTIDITQISEDSPYYGATATTPWGLNPNIDASQYSATVEAANHSMILIPLRKGIPWQPGYGYTTDMKLNITADDLLWTMSYYLDGFSQWSSAWGSVWGPDYRRAIEKINETMVKINFRGPLGNGIVPDWRDKLGSRWDVWPLPRHILDPTFDARPFGGAVGVTPDGTEILPYVEQGRYRYNTGEGDRPLPGSGPYYLEQWDEIQQLATYQKFANWGGYGAASLWHDPGFQQNNIDSIGLRVMTNSFAAILALELEEVDIVDSQFIGTSDLPYLARQPSIQLEQQLGSFIQGMIYDQWGPKLNNRYVRLAISHLVPGQLIVDYILGGAGELNEVIWFPLQDPHYPTDEEWAAIGLPESENAEDPETGDIVEFQGHIRYSREKAWALMEKANYDMTPFRDAVWREEADERAEQDFEPLPLLLALGVSLTIVGTVFVLGRHYWERYQLARGPEALRLSQQRKQLMDAIALRQSPRITEKAQAQDLFQQIANEDVLSPDLTIYAMLSLCDMLLDEAKAYGEHAVFQEAENLSVRISNIAREQESGSLQVEALLLRSKFALLRGEVTQADNLLEQAFVISKGKQLPKLTQKVTQEQLSLQKEVVQWEKLAAQAAPLRERLEYARLQDYIANAVRVIEESAHLETKEVSL